MKTKHILLFTLALSSVAFSNTFTYKLLNVPYKDIETCSQQAKLIAEKMAAQAAVPTSNARCEWDEFINKTSILVDYIAEKQLPVVSTSPLSIKALYSGFYPDLESCQSAISDEQTLFEKETGLTALTGFCYKESDYSKRFGFKIEAIGEAKRAPRYTTIYSDATILSPKAQELEQKAKEYFSGKKANLVHVGFRSSMPDNTIVLFYYAETELEFSRSVLSAQENLQTCTRELSTLQEKLERFGIHMPLSYCGASYTSKDEADLYLFPEAGAIQVKKSLETFTDYKSCMIGRNALVEKYQAAMGSNVLDGICGKEVVANNYRVSLIIKK